MTQVYELLEEGASAVSKPERTPNPLGVLLSIITGLALLGSLGWFLFFSHAAGT